MDPQLFDTLSDIRRELTSNHTEVVQRLTALETRISESPVPEIEARVQKLEGWRNKIAGFTIAANMAWVGATIWLRHSTK